MAFFGVEIAKIARIELKLPELRLKLPEFGLKLPDLIIFGFNLLKLIIFFLLPDHPGRRGFAGDVRLPPSPRDFLNFKLLKMCFYAVFKRF